MVKQGPETTGNKRSEPLNKCPALGNEGHLEARKHWALHRAGELASQPQRKVALQV